MRIIDLDDEHREDWLHCLEPWSAEAREGRDRRAAWYERVRDQGLIVKLAIDDDGAAAGMIQAVPAAAGLITGEGVYQVLCIWVHGYKRKGVGDRQGKGLGQALLTALEAEIRGRGGRGVAAWGISGPFWMRAAWFKRHGYRPVDRDGLAILLFKPLVANAQPPRWLPRGAPPAGDPDAVSVVCYNHGWCMAQDVVCERARRAAASFPRGVTFREVPTGSREAVRALGFSDALFIDGKRVVGGPPPSEAGLRARITWRRLVHRAKRFVARSPVGTR